MGKEGGEKKITGRDAIGGVKPSFWMCNKNKNRIDTVIYHIKYASSKIMVKKSNDKSKEVQRSV